VNDLIHRMDGPALRANLYLTQGMLLLMAVVGSLWQHGWSETIRLFQLPASLHLAYAGGIVALVVAASVGMEHFLPARWQDDGEISRKLFAGLSVMSTLLLCTFVGVSEEWLFRGVLQPLLGNFWTSTLFVLVHHRYLRKPLLVISVFATSWLLGWLFTESRGLVAPVVAHTMIDFMLALYLRLFVQKKGANKDADYTKRY
jgi:membrane protease YdiL (CAAX protease family)